MKRNPISDDVRQFILSSIPSVPYLEALLLLRSTPDSQWNATQLARRLYQAEKVAAEILAELHANGLASVAWNPGAYRYLPQAPELRDMIERVAASYSGNLVAISNLIHSGHSTSRHGSMGRSANGRGGTNRRQS
jgi:hypothetical protein